MEELLIEAFIALQEEIDCSVLAQDWETKLVPIRDQWGLV